MGEFVGPVESLSRSRRRTRPGHPTSQAQTEVPPGKRWRHQRLTAACASSGTAPSSRSAGKRSTDLDQAIPLTLNQRGRTMPQLTKAMAAAALQPRRYYLMPLRVHATYHTVTAIPKWMDKHQTQRGPEAQPSTYPPDAARCCGPHPGRTRDPPSHLRPETPVVATGNAHHPPPRGRHQCRAAVFCTELLPANGLRFVNEYRNRRNNAETRIDHPRWFPGGSPTVPAPSRINAVAKPKKGQT
jgi:hypothetical protein